MAGKRFAGFTVFALLALALAVLASTGSEAQSYKPFTSYSLTDYSPDAASDISISFSIPAPDYNYSDAMLVNFSPPDVWVASAGEIPIGEGVGTLSAISTVGLVNNPCSTALSPVFDLYNASVDVSDELDASQMNWLLKDKNNVPIPYEGYTGPNGDDPQLPDYLEGYPYFLNELLDPDGPGGLAPLQPRARYAGHDFVAGNNILIQFLVFNPGQLSELDDVRGITAQMTSAMGSPTYVVLNNPVSWDAAPGVISDFCTPLNTTTTLFGVTGDNPRTGAINDGCARVGNYDDCDANCDGDCDDAGEDELCGLDRNDDDTCDTAEPALARRVNDGCPPVDGSETGAWQCGNDLNDDGDPPVEGGVTARTNPPSYTGILGTGTHMTRNYSQSERDADGDGYENDLDPCPYTVDPGWDPTYLDPEAPCNPGDLPGDTDCDGLPDSCDPDITGTTADPDSIDCIGPQNDCDDDGYKNRQDICPLVANGCNNPACGWLWNAAWDNQADSDSLEPNADLGPGSDSIGDACDDSDCDGVEDGAVTDCSCADGIDNGTVGGPDNLIDGNDPDCQPYMDSQDPDPWGSNPGTGQFYHAMPWSAVCVGPAGSDDDGDGYCDDTETALGSDPNNGAETECDDAVDDDGDTYINDGCPQVGDFVEKGECGNDTDDDNDTRINDGCPANGDAENPATECDDAVDDDGDTYINDGCPQVGDFVEKGAECQNDESDDTTGDLCPPDGSSPGPDCLEEAMGEAVNDGCSAIGVPESLVIDAQISAPEALPQADVAQSCNDGVDNDGDGKVDGADNDALGCDPTTYTGDWDYDGVDDGIDNCPAVWNPEQTNTDVALADAGASVVGDGLGDACDDDDDGDGFDDQLEWYLATDPLDNCPNVIGGHDAWPLDMNMDTFVSAVGDVVLSYRGNIATMPGSPGWNQRLDLDGNGIIMVIGDILHYRGMIGATCDGGTFHSYTWPGTPVTMGIDPEITGNSADTLGDLEACVRIDVDPEDFGDDIADHTIDVYVTDAEDLYPTGYDAWVAYDPDRVDPVSWDDLIKFPGGYSMTFKMPPQLNGAAAYFNLADSGIPGDGTVVRIDLDVISAGGACFGFGFAKAYSSTTVVHPPVTRAASLAINMDCATGDSDGDDVIDMCDNCRDDPNPGQEDFDADDWGDVCDYCLTTPTKWYTPPGDEDCDGFSTAVEQYVGTDPVDNCPDWTGTPDLCPGPTCDGDDVWPLDVNVDRVITVSGDVLNYRGRLQASGGPPPDPNWLQRLDINMDNVITVSGDVLLFRGMLQLTCT